MRWPIIVAVATGCGFHPVPFSNSDAVTNDPDAPARHVDAAHLDTTLALDARPSLCHAPDTTGIVLCLELDDTGLTAAKDGSGLGHDATVANVSAITRPLPATSQGAQIVSSSVIQTADSTDFDLQTFTLMMWVHRENTPGSNGEYALIDIYDQYRMRIDDQGKLSCVIETVSNIYPLEFSSIPLDDWSLVACTYDGANVCGYVFDATANTTQGSCSAISKTLDTGGDQGVSVGSLNQGDATYVDHLAGKLDSARIFSRVLTQQEICIGGGLTGC